MRNLKRLFAVVIAVALMATALVPAFAADTAATTTAATKITSAKACEQLGMVIGEGSGVTAEYLAKTPTRFQAAVMFLRLKGLEAEAKAFKVDANTPNFDDADLVGYAEGKAIMAYLKAHSELGMIGKGDNKYDPLTTITAQEFYKVLLEALGYKQGTDFEWDTVLKVAEEKGLSKSANATNFTVNDLAIATVEALVAPIKGDAKTTLGVKILGAEKAKVLANVEDPTPVTPGELSVLAIAAKTASSFAVTFNKPVDTSKVAFTVTRGTNEEKMKASWNKDKAVATLERENGSKLVFGDYTIKVVVDKKELATKAVSITQEKIGSIDLQSDMIIRTSETEGQIQYKVLNQYGEDISTSAFASSITWTPGAVKSYSVDTKNALIKLVSNDSYGSRLMDMKTLTLTAFVTNSDNTTVSMNKTVSISETVGGIASIKFLNIISPSGKNEIVRDSTDRFFIDYEAKDINGNKIDSYDILSLNKLAFTVMPNTNSNNIWAEVIRDPDNNSKALIEIKWKNDSNSSKLMDDTGIITGLVMTNGKSDSVTVVVKRPPILNKFMIQAPSIDICANEDIEIPFVAYDQLGNEMNKYTDINTSVNVTSSNPSDVIRKEINGDGTFRLVGNFSYDTNFTTRRTLTATVPDAGNISQINIDVNAPAIPYTLSEVDTSIVVPAIMTGGGEITADFKDYVAFKVLDQYGRDYNMATNSTKGSNKYYISATSNDTAKVSVSGAAYGSSALKLTGVASGSATITFNLIKKVGTTETIIDYRTVSLRVVEKKDVSGYEIAKIATLYAVPTITAKEGYGTASDFEKEYAQEIKIYGKLSGGARVALNPVVGAGKDILGVSVSDTDKFSVSSEGKYVVGKEITDPTAKATLTAVVQADTNVQSVTFAIDSALADPTAKSIDAKLSADSVVVKDGDNYSIKLADAATALNSKSIFAFSATGSAANRAQVYVTVTDQYGVDALTPVYVSVTKRSGSGTITVDSATGVLTTTAAAAGDVYAITAVASNGLTKTITLRIN